MLWLLLSADGSMILSGLLVIPVIAAWVVGVSLAHRCARKRNSHESEQSRKQTKDPYLAAFLSMVFPGVGHLYLRRWLAGVLFLMCACLLYFARVAPPLAWTKVPAEWKQRLIILVIVGEMVWFTYVALAALLAYRRGPQERRRGGAGIAAVCVLCLVSGPLPMALAQTVRAHCVEAFAVPVGSMAPTIQPGDKVLAWKRPFVPKRGDLIVFKNPMDRTQNYVKRVVAVAGETIELRDGNIYVNGTALDQGALGGSPYAAGLRSSPAPQWAGEGSPFTVPQGHVFVLGDNIERSFDSRFFGPVPVADIVGRAYKRYWPLDRAGPLH
jgi:signal peptidase I